MIRRRCYCHQLFSWDGPCSVCEAYDHRADCVECSEPIKGEGFERDGELYCETCASYLEPVRERQAA